MMPGGANNVGQTRSHATSLQREQSQRFGIIPTFKNSPDALS
jgi:hypothetical protein